LFVFDAKLQKKEDGALNKADLRLNYLNNISKAPKNVMAMTSFLK
jgi:hypothetical protein